MKKKIIISVMMGIAGFAMFKWYEKWKTKRDLDNYLHRKIESKFTLSEGDKARMPRLDSAGVKVYRYRDDSGAWQVALDKVPDGTSESMIMGILHSKPVDEVVKKPVYLCSYTTGFSKPTSSLDLDSKCTAGKSVIDGPVGYLSQQIRQGYFLIFRCRSVNDGIYLSLNSRCESKEDMLQSSLGAIRAVEH